MIELFESKDWDLFETFFPKERNDYAHRRLGVSEDFARSQLELIHPELKEVNE